MLFSTVGAVGSTGVEPLSVSPYRSIVVSSVSDAILPVADCLSSATVSSTSSNILPPTVIVGTPTIV